MYYSFFELEINVNQFKVGTQQIRVDPKLFQIDALQIEVGSNLDRAEKYVDYQYIYAKDNLLQLEIIFSFVNALSNKSNKPGINLLGSATHHLNVD